MHLYNGDFMKKKTLYKLLSVIVTVISVILLMVFMFSGDNLDLLKSIFAEEHTKEELRDKLADFGVRGYITVVMLSMLQVIMTFMPAEPVQVIAGVTFGFSVGLACCMIGVLIGNTIIYLLYRKFGNKLNDYFDRKLHFDVSKLSTSKRVALIILVMYFLPAIPYGMICFVAATTRMKYPRYITLTVLGSLPSVCVGVVLGHVAIASSWTLTLIILGVIIVLVALMMIYRDKLFALLDSWMSDSNKKKRTEVKLYRPSALIIPHIVNRIILFFKGVKVKYTYKVKRVDNPSIVLCNHGAFIDFVYAGTMLRKQSPNFPVARLYFYKNIFGNILRRFGCFPKSMFALDIESVRNCVKVVRSGGVLAMMPEARLSTAGEFEDIQPSTYSFIKKMGVPVYTIRINGDYLAKPKWGDKIRRGAIVEAELDILLDAESVAALSERELAARVEERLGFNEFEWLAQRPKIRYRSRTIAVGLENILNLCPKCGELHSLRTKGRVIWCEKCGLECEVDDRYNFVGDVPFKNHLEWYRWQMDRMRQRIAEDPNFHLHSRVTLKHSSKDGKTSLRVAGSGECTLDREGLTYVGSSDGEQIVKSFPLSERYRILFGAGEDFEVYEGKEIYFFVPEEPRSNVDWYIASILLKKEN